MLAGAGSMMTLALSEKAPELPVIVKGPPTSVGVKFPLAEMVPPAAVAQVKELG